MVPSRASQAVSTNKRPLTFNLFIFYAEELIRKFTLENGNNHHRFISTCGQYIYNIAIIDYLQAYDFEKWGEHQIKVWLYRRDGALISATHPDPYARRFLHFMREHAIIN